MSQRRIRRTDDSSLFSHSLPYAFLSCVPAVMAEDVRLPATGQQADVNHAISSDPVQCRQRHAALLRPGGHWTDGPSNHQVSSSVFLMFFVHVHLRTLTKKASTCSQNIVLQPIMAPKLQLNCYFEVLQRP